MSHHDPHFSRHDELQFLLDRVASGQSVSIVGVSNMGKSTLLRDLCQPDVRAALRPDLGDDLHFFYIDCNRMLDQSAHAFYELTVRVLVDELRSSHPDLSDELRAIYDELVYPRSDFHIPLSFNQALTTLVEQVGGRAVLIFDEFDASYADLDARVFLNMRAMKDRYSHSLAYVLASDRRLSHIRSGEAVDEFKELFDTAIHYVGPLSERDTRHYIASRMQDLNASFGKNDVAFILLQAGGHPALTEIACRRLADVTGRPARSESEDWLIHREVEDVMRQDLSVSAECHKIWRDLTVGEQAALEALFQPGESGDARAYDELKRRGLLLRNGYEPNLFARLFEDYILRRRAAQHGIEYGVHVDVDSGEVTVDGRPTEILTNLEFRLLLLLYGHLNKIVGKYEIVEAVWGEDYIDEVYDSSIEKLVSRLRQKIEPNPGDPRYIITMRGRGYKLVG